MTLLAGLLLTAFSLSGTIRASDSGEPIPGAVVEAVVGGQRVLTDSVGRYVLDGLSLGRHELRVSRTGYEEWTVEVLVGQDSAMRLDFSLTPKPVLLSQVRVVAHERGATDGKALSAPVGDAEVGSRSATGDRLRSDPALGEADVLQSLAATPGVVANPESPTSLHVRGGSSDQNVILLDGVPLYNPYHATGVLGAIDPDAVSSVTMHAGVPSARYGGAASSVIALRSEEPDEASVTTRGAVGFLSLHEMVTGPLPGSTGTFLVSGRRSTRDFFAGGVDQTNSIATFGDLFAKATVRFSQGDLELFSFSSADRLAFDAVVDSNFDASAAPVASEVLRNGFEWSTGTQALIWRSDREAATRFEARAWRTRFDAAGDWAAASGPIHLTSGLTDVGLGGDASWPLAFTFATAGVSAERMHTEYDLRRGRTAATDSTLPDWPALSASPLLFAAFFEDRWAAGTRWTFTGGLRYSVASTGQRELEPRVSARFVAAPWLTLSAGYARTHQDAQSLRNEESLLDAVVGIGLPAATGTSGVPVARAEQLTISVQARLGAATTLSLDGYTRRLEGLLLVAPVTAQPFDTGGFSRGRGRASGATLQLEESGERVFGHVAYGFEVVSRETGSQRYQPSFAVSHSLTAAVGYHPWAFTTVRTALWATFGRPTSVVEGEIAWTPHTLLGGTGDLVGSPQRIVGALDGGRLSPYVRVDVGIRHEWHTGLFGRAAGIAGVLNVSNVFDRANALTQVVSADARTRRTIPMLPRSVTLGLEWAY